MKKKYKSLAIKVLGAVIISFIVSYIAMFICFTLYANIMYKYLEIWTNKYNYFALLPTFISIATFVLIFLLLVNRRMKYFKYIINSVKKIDSVEFLSALDEKGNDEFTELAQSINIMNKRIQDKFIKEKEIEDSKYELVTSVSHDLKTPLTSIIGYLELLNDNRYGDDKTRDEYISIVYNKSLRLKDLVNELFEYTKLTGSDVRFEVERFNISSLINQIVGESIINFNEKNIDVILENPYKELYSNVDPKLISRVFENIIKNAEKYSNSDSTFKIIVESSENNIYIFFINKCKGIEEKDINKVFEKFYRLDAARSNEKDGSGLGLSIAKTIIELHNGELNAEKQGDNIIFKIRLDNISKR